jgi:hypothetical protein
MKASPGPRAPGAAGPCSPGDAPEGASDDLTVELTDGVATVTMRQPLARESR